MLRRKRSDIALGPSRANGTQGVRIIHETYFNGASTSSTLTAPPSVEPGDFLLIMGICTGSGAAATITGVTLSFYLNALGQSPNSQRFKIWHGWSPDSTPRSCSITFAAGGYLWGYYVLRGVNTIQPIDTASYTPVDQPSSTTHTHTGITTFTDRALVFAMHNTGGNPLPTLTPPSSPWTTRRNASESTFYTAMTISSQVKAAAGLVSDSSMGLSVARTGGSFMFAVREMPG